MGEATIRRHPAARSNPNRVGELPKSARFDGPPSLRLETLLESLIGPIADLISRLGSLVLPALVALVVLLALPSSASAQCVDEALKQQLIGQRAYRGVVPRLFKKALRHELSAMGGWFAGDISDGAPMYGGAYTFHFTEDLRLEAALPALRAAFRTARSVADRQQGLVDIVEAEDHPIQFFMGHLVWSLAYGKVRWMGGGISRFDFSVALGAGMTVEPGDKGLTGSGGFGRSSTSTTGWRFASTCAIKCVRSSACSSESTELSTTSRPWAA